MGFRASGLPRLPVEGIGAVVASGHELESTNALQDSEPRLPRVAWMVGFLEMIRMVQQETRKQPTKTTRKKNENLPKKHMTWFGCKMVKFCLEKINMPKKQMKSFFKELYRTNKAQKNGERKKGHTKLNLQIGRVFLKLHRLRNLNKKKFAQKVVFVSS